MNINIRLAYCWLTLALLSLCGQSFAQRNYTRTITTRCLVDSKTDQCIDNTTDTQVHIDKVGDQQDSWRWPNHSFYSGVGLGYGNTDWSQLVGQDWKARLSTPDSAKSNGLSWSLFTGYYLLDNLAIELRFVHYQASRVDIGSFAHHIIYKGPKEFMSKTQSFSILGKFFVPIALHNRLRLFADVGANYTMRNDVYANIGTYGGTFGLGMQWRYSERFMSTIEGQYSTGNGSSVFNPMETYIPFLYNFELRTAYMFDL